MTSIEELRDKRVLVTGGSGFLGRHLSQYLTLAGANVVWPCRNRDHDGFVDLAIADEVDVMFGSAKPDYVFHLAGFNGGIAFNLKRPADIFYLNTLMGLNVIDACWRHGVEKVVNVVASCAYPEFEWRQMPGVELGDWNGQLMWPREVMVEKDFLNGPPHGTVACHAYAKRNLQLACSFFNEQYGLDAVCVCPTTLYGPGDSYDPERTKVMGGMVKRFVDAADDHQQEVVCWGSGEPHREFLYVEDAAQLLIQALVAYDDSHLPLNLGTGQELSIKELAGLVASAVQFNGKIRFDTSKPDGQLRKRLDLTRMKSLFPDFAPTHLSVGIARTVTDYITRKAEGRARQQERVA